MSNPNESIFKIKLKEKYGDRLVGIDPDVKKFLHICIVSETIVEQYKVFRENFINESENGSNDNVRMVDHLFLVTFQHMDMLLKQIQAIHSKYINNIDPIDRLEDKVYMRAWMNIICSCMIFTRSLLPAINIMKNENVDVVGMKDLAESFLEFLRLMRYLTSMSPEFERYINENTN